MAIDTETMQLIERIVARSVANATSLKGAAGEIAKGVTQYVGARYVPLFAEPLEWDKTKAYEPLTIVLHQGNSYTSRQYVPVGVEITNESFWANTGNYNAQVEQYRQEVKAFDGRITANAQAIEKEAEDRAAAVTAEKTRAEGAEKTLQSNIDAEKTRAEGAEKTLQSNIDAEKTRAEGAEKTLQQFNQNLPNYKKGDTLVIIGDSWCYAGYDWTGGMGVIGKTIADALGIKKVNNVSISGNGYVGNTGTYYNQLNSLNIDESDIALFIVFGSINDSGTDSSKEGLKENIAKFITLFKKKYPNTIAHVFAIDSSYTMTPAMLRTSRNIIKAYNGEPNFIIHDSNYFSNRYPYSHDTMWSSDDVHPTTAGLTYFASNMVRSILGNCGAKYIINDTIKPGIDSCTVINMDAGYIKFSVRFNEDVELNQQQNVGITEHGILPFESPTSYVLGSIKLSGKKELRIEINQTTGAIIGTVIGYESPVTYPAGTYFEFTYNIL